MSAAPKCSACEERQPVKKIDGLFLCRPCYSDYEEWLEYWDSVRREELGSWLSDPTER
jgi:hypothetical protein